MNTLIVGLLVYAIVTTCYLFSICVYEEENPIDHIFLNVFIAVIIYSIVMGIIEVYLYFQ